MRIRALVSPMIPLLLGAACHRAPAPAAAAPAAAPAPFAIVVEHSESGWRAHCETGCRWVDVTMTCAGCAVRVDVSGIMGADAPAEAVPGFAFVLSAVPGGWAARGVQGVRWERVTWTCSAAACRGRLDESGVSGA